MRRLNICVLASALALLLAGAGEAEAALVTVGSTLSPTNSRLRFLAPGTVTNTALSDPAAMVASPIDGAVVGFGVASPEGTFKLRVLRPAPGGAYTAVATSVPLVVGAAESGFPPIPIQAGDTIGLDVAENSVISYGAIGTSSTYGSWFPPLREGTTLPVERSKAGGELAFHALVEPPPTITSITPPGGSFRGGTRVLIHGHDFLGATGVMFGARPALHVRVLSADTATAVTAPSAGPRPVPVRIATVAGSSQPTAAARFAFTACVVPRLLGRTVAAASAAARRSDCRLGRISRRGRGGAAKVVEQSPRPGRRLDPGSAVSIVVG